MNDHNRVLIRQGARELNEQEVEKVSGGVRTLTACTLVAVVVFDVECSGSATVAPSGAAFMRPVSQLRNHQGGTYGPRQSRTQPQGRSRTQRAGSGRRNRRLQNQPHAHTLLCG